MVTLERFHENWRWFFGLICVASLLHMVCRQSKGSCLSVLEFQNASLIHRHLVCRLSLEFHECCSNLLHNLWVFSVTSDPLGSHSFPGVSSNDDEDNFLMNHLYFVQKL